MTTYRALASIALFAASNVACSASNCSVTFRGKSFIRDLFCEVSTKNGVTTFEQGNFFTAEIRKGILSSNVGRFGGPKKQQYVLDSFGMAKETPGEDGICYETEELKVCSSGGDPD